MTQIWWWTLRKIWPNSAVWCGAELSATPRQSWWYRKIRSTKFFLRFRVGLGKRAREVLQRVFPRRKQIYFEFQKPVLSERDVPLRNGRMPAISFSESHVSAQATRVGTRSSESISGSATDIVHVPRWVTPLPFHFPFLWKGVTCLWNMLCNSWWNC